MNPHSTLTPPALDASWFVRTNWHVEGKMMFGLKLYSWSIQDDLDKDEIVTIEIIPRKARQFLAACKRRNLNVGRLLGNAVAGMISEVLAGEPESPVGDLPIGKPEAAPDVQYIAQPPATPAGQHSVTLTFTDEEWSRFSSSRTTHFPLVPMPVFLESLAVTQFESVYDDGGENLRCMIADAFDRSVSLEHTERVFALGQADNP